MTAARKTEQALKISASWTPGPVEAAGVSKGLWGQKTPLLIRGGRMTVNAAIAIDMTDPMQAARVAERVKELRKELEATGTVHSFVTQAGAVPAGTAERLLTPEEEADVKDYGTDDERATK